MARASCSDVRYFCSVGVSFQPPPSSISSASSPTTATASSSNITYMLSHTPSSMIQYNRTNYSTQSRIVVPWLPIAKHCLCTLDEQRLAISRVGMAKLISGAGDLHTPAGVEQTFQWRNTGEYYLKKRRRIAVLGIHNESMMGSAKERLRLEGMRSKECVLRQGYFAGMGAADEVRQRAVTTVYRVAAEIRGDLNMRASSPRFHWSLHFGTHEDYGTEIGLFIFLKGADAGSTGA
ncbi:hypothetical protein BDK51DRAFT_36652 [Blyttiomyces helicus]|uniref:Uncharacterized protein n=1 Tax=Blyttiomyces helicus TaxID=388810 RepID=A0A4P9WP31_9FUNG|nr:hypothetical protein BDK51DRAFT_36652 [Blyttiomyces helicus]|eukprot:RKO93478.1 hypothetical protein BDK51DRAFT_36652 [Blyttiomyces helicus]